MLAKKLKPIGARYESGLTSSLAGAIFTLLAVGNLTGEGAKLTGVIPPALSLPNVGKGRKPAIPLAIINKWNTPRCLYLNHQTDYP